MPYEVRKVGDEFCVYKKDEPDGESMGCHATKPEANDQVSALYAEEEAKLWAARKELADARKDFLAADVVVVEAELAVAAEAIAVAVEEDPSIIVVDEVTAAKFDVDAPCAKKMLKMRARKDGTLAVGAYATVWGELDCDGEKMTQRAVEPYLGKGRPLMMWLHGMDKRMGSTPVGEWDKLTTDAFGLYAEGTVTEPRAVEMLKSAGAYGLSVGSLWYLIKKEGAAGSEEITDWPLLEISIMEGGKQCVPSAHRDLADKALSSALGTVAAKMGLKAAGALNQKEMQARARRIIALDTL